MKKTLIAAAIAATVATPAVAFDYTDNPFIYTTDSTLGSTYTTDVGNGKYLYTKKFFETGTNFTSTLIDFGMDKWTNPTSQFMLKKADSLYDAGQYSSAATWGAYAWVMHQQSELN